MKRLSLAILFLLVLPGILSVCWARELKIGYIDSERILAEFPESQEAQSKLAEENREWETQAGSMDQQIEDLSNQLEQQKLLLSEEKRAEKEQELQALYIKAQQFKQEIWGQDGKLYQRNLELTRPVVEKINAVISKIGDEENYDFIFDATQGNIVHAKAEYDITDRVLELLQKE